MMKPALPLVAAAALALAAAGCSSSNDGGSAAPAAPAPAPSASGSPATTADTVNIQNFAFNPATVTVAPGTAVTWKFDDDTDHTVVADDNSFSSQPEGKGQTYSHTFATAGTVAYHCSIHPFMKATVTVK